MLRLGETFVYGLEPDQARRIMRACSAVGVDRQVIRTTDSGFIVPNVVADELAAMDVPAWAAESAVI